ncbi:MAG: ion transporter [Xanthomonadales bacterium]|nr:ion transporter [Xanthomonadales bacterium]
MVSFKQIIEENNSASGKAFDLIIQVLIVLSLISFSVETLPNLEPDTRTFLHRFEIFTVIIFSFEYLSRILVASNKRGYIFSFFGILDLLAILPFYLSTGVDLRSLRIFRLLRLVRILKFARYSAAAKRFHRAFILAKEELVLFLFVTLILIFLAGVGIYYFENPVQPESFASIFHSLWWAISTLTTVGYGDIYPVTVGGKLFTFGILLIGLGIVAVPAGVLASALAKAREMEN